MFCIITGLHSQFLNILSRVSWASMGTAAWRCQGEPQACLAPVPGMSTLALVRGPASLVFLPHVE